MFAVVAVVLLILGLLDILTFQQAVLWGLLFIALGVIVGWYPLAGAAPWRRTT